eukprot:TRINITY_DN4344_c0_g1_i1.p1 TRINITY_DN4344_c0_g1~~TRINITY_DN4344_c0_g1_i1.p1  ORF type:complete len:435 (-),score=53.89 TRINITY_DN4344_c0_g1_i1:382-1686(-)
MAKKKPSVNPGVHYEFGGPLGAVGVMVGLPVLVAVLYGACNSSHCVSFGKPLPELKDIVDVVVAKVGNWKDLSLAMTVVTVWWSIMAVLSVVLPGETVQGLPLPTTLQERLSYRMNGHLQFWVTLLGCLALHFIGVLPLTEIHDLYLPLAAASVAFSFLLSTFLYVSSFIGQRVLAVGGNTGNVVYDFFIGRELNPRVGPLDLKEFCELRPGLIGWTVINVGLLLKQYERDGNVNAALAAVVVFQGLYVWDSLYNEVSVLSTMDITTDGFGFMLAFGDLSWVPFTYSLQARYLVDHTQNSAQVSWLPLIIALNIAGYSVFRLSNSEKDRFRRNPKDPHVAHLKTLDTKRGTRLLVSGWWGLARKINYTGDWLMGLSWCLYCGVYSPIPFFYAAYFLVLLVHRAIRDDGMCRAKYGDDWTKYKRLVPKLFIPYII